MTTKLNRMFLVAALLTAGMLGGCPSDDDGDDDACTQASDPQCNLRPDAGTDSDADLQPDADVTAPDASIDANGDPCADHYDLAGDWTCIDSGGGIHDETVTLLPWEDKCFVDMSGGDCEVTADMTSTSMVCAGLTCYR